MKSKIIFLVMIAFVTMSFHNPAGLSDAERNYASKLLQETQIELLNKLRRLTPEQLNFKPDTASWSIAECVEHIAVTESGLFGISQSAMKQPADPSRRSEVKMSDEALVKMITDRNTRYKATDAVKPSGRYASNEAALKEFISKRESHIEYIKTTSDDLRNHYHVFPFGTIDAYQSILFMAGHSKRHTDQIEEIMNNASFPKKKG
ncbi:MAG TPA: DinB family protein [Sphingobacteriaceae bacterium]